MRVKPVHDNSLAGAEIPGRMEKRVSNWPATAVAAGGSRSGGGNWRAPAAGRRFTFAACLLALATLVAPAPVSAVSLEWSKVVLSSTKTLTNGYGSAGIYLADGSVYAAASKRDGRRDIIRLQKYTSTGALLWTRVLSSSTCGYFFPRLAVDQSSGSVYLAASFRPNGITRRGGFLRKYSGAGAVKWTKRYGAAGLYDGIPAVAVDPRNGDVVISRVGAGVGSVKKLSPAGRLVWSTSGVWGSSLAVEPVTGKVIFALKSSGGGFTLSSLPAAGGLVSWTRSVGVADDAGQPCRGEWLAGIALGADSSVFLVGNGEDYYSCFEPRFVLGKYRTSDGAELWKKTEAWERDSWGITKGIRAHAVASDSLGAVYVSGHVPDTMKMFTRSYSASGVAAWTTFEDYSLGGAVAADSVQGAYSLRYTNGAYTGSYDARMLKYR